MNRILLVSVIAFSACASSFKVKTDYDAGKNFSAYKTYSFTDTRSVPSKPGVATADVRKRIEDAISSQLESSGLKGKASGESPDLFIYYWVAKEDKTRTAARPAGTHKEGVYNAPATYNFTEGTLILDLIEAKSNDVAWRTSVSGVLSDKKEDNAQKLREALAEAFAKFPRNSK